MFWNVLGQHFSGIAEGGWFHKKTILPKWKQRLLLNWSEQITKLKHLKPSLTSATPASACGRMNGAITKGLEEDVGNKTSVYVHTAHSITSSRYILKKHGYKAAPHDEVMKLFIGPWFLFYFTRVKMASLSSFSFWQGIKYVMIPEGWGITNGLRAFSKEKGSLLVHTATDCEYQLNVMCCCSIYGFLWC